MKFDNDHHIFEKISNLMHKIVEQNMVLLVSQLYLMNDMVQILNDLPEKTWKNKNSILMLYNIYQYHFQQ